MTAPTIPLGTYLWKRLSSLGIEHVFGVPGDFNLNLLDHIYNVPELTWLGTCNELNGAYATDGYARIKGTPTALLTTYAVGELSALNGVGGAFSEHAGMIHLVGMPSRAVQKSRIMMHHTLKDKMDYSTYVKMGEPLYKTHTILNQVETMASEIDRVIADGVRSRLPVCIYVPADVVFVHLDATRLLTPLDTNIRNQNRTLEEDIVHKVLALIKESSQPAILADVLAIRYGSQELVKRLVAVTHFPTYSTHLAKGIIDENSFHYNGLYNGKASFPGVQEAVEGADLVLNIGPLLSDSNTGGFTRQIADQNLVLLGHEHCQIRQEIFRELHFLPILERIVEALEKNPKSYNLPREQFWTKLRPPVLNPLTSGPIMQSYLWQRLGDFLMPNDIVIAEAGTAQFGSADATFPDNVSYITQIYWSAIGYTVGACLGACVAAKERKDNRRVILMVGEGSLQMTVQELGSIIRFGFKPIILLINNDGYAIERAINGPEQGYNDISMLWDHQKMLEFFGARKETGIKSKSFACKTVEDLEKVLSEEEFRRGEYIQLCEIFTGKFDYPWRLSLQVKIAQDRIKKSLSA